MSRDARKTWGQRKGADWTNKELKLMAKDDPERKNFGYLGVEGPQKGIIGFGAIVLAGLTVGYFLF